MCSVTPRSFQNEALVPIYESYVQKCLWVLHSRYSIEQKERQGFNHYRKKYNPYTKLHTKMVVKQYPTLLPKYKSVLHFITENSSTSLMLKPGFHHPLTHHPNKKGGILTYSLLSLEQRPISRRQSSSRKKKSREWDEEAYDVEEISLLFKFLCYYKDLSLTSGFSLSYHWMTECLAGELWSQVLYAWLNIQYYKLNLIKMSNCFFVMDNVPILQK